MADTAEFISEFANTADAHKLKVIGSNRIPRNQGKMLIHQH